MAIQKIITKLGAQPLPADGNIVGGVWWLSLSSDCDLVVERNVRATLVVLDGDGAHDMNIDVLAGAELRLLHVVASHSASQIAVAIAEGASCLVTEIVVTAADTRIAASLVERGARFELGGAFVLTEDDKASVTVDVNHLAEECTSHTSYKGVASGEAHGSFSGLVYVALGAQRTDSVQSSRNITIGNAHIETLPQLEIYADDVKCSHGATVGQMDGDALLYMRQRGLDLAIAKRLQIEGFVGDVILHSVVEDVEELLSELVAEKLNRL
ncbi:MAG: SufD family Fe-S cluster assembly protein [Alistipes sp.]|nr:SufD family Fe-S cluster assembly protein [Alistipes sp.]